jgi:predicted secreted Zn-dependent protease
LEGRLSSRSRTSSICAVASRVGYLEGPRGCKVSSASVTVKAKIILPRWRRPRSAEADVRLIWDTLASDIKRHEESHVSIAKNHARDLEQELRRIGTQRDCAAARARVGEVTRKVLARHDRAQTDFDRAEGANFEQRILRLLRYRMQRMANGRLRD